MSDETADRVRDVVERILDALEVDGDVEVSDDGEEIVARVTGEQLGIVIGRHGQTIDAIQHLAYRIAGAEGTERRRVVVDAAGYRDRRAAILRRQADRAADDAERYGRPVALDAMSATERRLVHEYLRERGGVETYSEGEEPDRHLVVAPLE